MMHGRLASAKICSEALMCSVRPIVATLLLAVSFYSPSVLAESMNGKSLPSDHVLLKESGLPFGLPRFAEIKDADFEAAYDVAMAEHLREVNAIAHGPTPATFDNTVVALERAGASLSRVGAVFGNLTASN